MFSGSNTSRLITWRLFSLFCEAIDCGPPTNKSDIEVNNIMNTSLNGRASIGCHQFGFTFSPLENYSQVEIKCGNDSVWKSNDGNISDVYRCVGMRFWLVQIEINIYLCNCVHTCVFVILTSLDMYVYKKTSKS